jgi:exosome complex RNA-binding protein Csl4
MEKAKLLVKNKDVVVPGEIMAEGMSYLPSQGTYRNKNNVIA